MDTASKKQLDFKFDILPRATKKAFIFLSKQAWISKSDWYLVGGTALALLFGQRRSVDLDFLERKFQE